MFTEINDTKEVKKQKLPAPYRNPKVNATVDTMQASYMIRKNRTNFPVASFQIPADATYGCLPVRGLVKLGFISIFEAHKLGLTERV
tara:strand:- start:830 stop:1090 length:261 start_codon:yes stop_codon:yes gene_type:complete